MHHKSPRANNCPSPAPADVRVFHTCGRIVHILKTEGTAGCSAPSPKEGPNFSSISDLCPFPHSLAVKCKSNIPRHPESVFPKQELTQTIHIRLQLPVFLFIHCADARPLETMWAGWYNGHKTNMTNQMPAATNWKIPYRNSSLDISKKWSFCHYLLV